MHSNIKQIFHSIQLDDKGVNEVQDNRYVAGVAQLARARDCGS